MKNAFSWVTFPSAIILVLDTHIFTSGKPLANAGAGVGQGMEPRILNTVQGT